MPMALIAHQKLRIARLERQLYGQRSERSVRLIDQLALVFEDLQAEATEDELTAEAAIARTTTVSGFTRLCRDFRAGQCINGSIRARNSSVPARPYIERFRVLRRLICPSVCLLLHVSLMALPRALRRGPSAARVGGRRAPCPLPRTPARFRAGGSAPRSSPTRASDGCADSILSPSIRSIPRSFADARLIAGSASRHSMSNGINS